MYTIQMMADEIATHMLTQNERSVTSDGMCLYRGPRGLMCAAGKLIDDAKYHEDIEGGNALDAIVMKTYRDEVKDLLSNNAEAREVLRKSQGIHDGVLAPASWPKFLRDLFIRHDLNPAVITNFSRP